MSSFIDILRFPLNRTGLAHIGLFTFLLFALKFFEVVLSKFLGPFGMYAGLAIGMVNVLVGIEIIQYFYLCVQESAQGALAAPDNMFADSFKFESWGDLFEEFAYHISPYLVCFMPAILYRAFTNQTDTPFFMLLIAGGTYFPMLFLAVAMFNSSASFNLFIHIISILKTFFSYCLLVIQLLLVVALSLVFGYFFQNHGLMSILLCPLQLYCMIVFTHLIGRYYCHNEAKLNWEV